MTTLGQRPWMDKRSTLLDFFDHLQQNLHEEYDVERLLEEREIPMHVVITDHIFHLLSRWDHYCYIPTAPVMKAISDEWSEQFGETKIFGTVHHFKVGEEP